MRMDVGDVQCSVPEYQLLLTDECAPDFGPHPSFNAECRTYQLLGGANRWSFIPERSLVIGECQPGAATGTGRVRPIRSRKVCCFAGRE